MDWRSLRRIVTGEDDAGRSRIHIDDEPAKLLALGGAGLAEIWTADLKPDRLFDAVDRLVRQDVRLEPDKGAVKVRWFAVAPEDDGRTPEEKETLAASAFAAVGAADARIDTARHPAMHKTDTLDVIILVKGEVDLILDDGDPTPLKPGDVVIQRATNHAWVNHGAESALLVAVLMNAG